MNNQAGEIIGEVKHYMANNSPPQEFRTWWKENNAASVLKMKIGVSIIKIEERRPIEISIIRINKLCFWKKNIWVSNETQTIHVRFISCGHKQTMISFVEPLRSLGGKKMEIRIWRIKRVISNLAGSTQSISFDGPSWLTTTSHYVAWQTTTLHGISHKNELLSQNLHSRYNVDDVKTILCVLQRQP